VTIAAALLTIAIVGVVALAATAEAAGIDLQVAGGILCLRPAAHQRERVDSSTTQIGFRCLVRVGA